MTNCLYRVNGFLIQPESDFAVDGENSKMSPDNLEQVKLSL